MKKLFFMLMVYLIPLAVKSQGMLDPTKWSISYSKKEVKVNETVDIIFTVTIDDGWHFYSLGDEPPQASIILEGSGFQAIGKAKESEGVLKKFDENLEMNVKYFHKKAEFRQTVKILKKNAVINIEIEGQACPSGPGQCVRVNKSFTVSPNDLKILGSVQKPIDGNSQVAIINKDSLKTDSIKSIPSNPGNISGQSKVLPVIEKKIATDDSSLIALLLLSFGAGLLSLLTPCVFPMIPLTVTFFSTSSETRSQAIRKALFYGLSIIIIFTLIGIFAGPLLANELSTNWIPNLLFFIIFMVFGLSFLGLFEITLPSKFINKVDQQSEKGGFYGVFFMAFTLVLVSFSCTGPIIGIVLVQLQGGIALKPILSMLAFSVAFAIPFTLFALFPQWLQKLPRSGGWLNIIKVVLGFLEIALAFKFLSMVDQVYHLHILDREIYIAIWIVIFTLMGLYLLGKFKLPHDSDIQFLSVPRLILAMLPLVFVVYLFPGMFGAPLKKLSGYLPPMNTHDFDIPGIIRENNFGTSNNSSLCNEPKYSNNNRSLSLPHGLRGYFTYEEAIKCAKEKNLPVFIDFTGHACVSCREMEANVWSDPQVLNKLRNEFIIATLYVDDRTALNKEDLYVSPHSNKPIKTLGGKNTDLSVNKFKVNAQPYYVIIDPNDENKLVEEPIGYEPSIVKYLDYLNSGINKFKSKHPTKK